MIGRADDCSGEYSQASSNEAVICMRAASLVAVILALLAPFARADGRADANAGQAALNDGHYAEAVQLFTKALGDSLPPADEEQIRLKRGEAYLQVGDYSRALDDLNSALELNPRDQEAANARARVLAASAEAFRQGNAGGRADTAPRTAGSRQVSIKDLDGNVYTGAAIGREPEGEGVMRRANGDVFEGTFHHGDYVSGRYTYAYGDRYTGSFQNNDPSGGGTYSWANGTVFTGSFANGQPNGSGTFTYPDGRKYTGQVRDGLPDGTGTMTHPNGPTITGVWSRGRRVS